LWNPRRPWIDGWDGRRALPVEIALSLLARSLPIEPQRRALALDAKRRLEGYLLPLGGPKLCPTTEKATVKNILSDKPTAFVARFGHPAESA